MTRTIQVRPFRIQSTLGVQAESTVKLDFYCSMDEAVALQAALRDSEHFVLEINAPPDEPLDPELLARGGTRGGGP